MASKGDGDGATFLETLRAGGSFPVPGRNPGPMPVTGHFAAVLQQLLERLAAGDAAAARHVVHETEEFVTIYDGYPKSTLHLLVVPRQRVDSLKDLGPEHLPMLRRLAAYVAWALEGLAAAGAGNVGFVHGIHTVPSLRQLHVHILSQDFQSPCLKNAKHFGSFQSPFLVPLDDAIAALEASVDMNEHFGIGKAEERLKKQDLCCNRCGVNFVRRFAELKKHLASCKEMPPSAPPPCRWRDSVQSGGSTESLLGPAVTKRVADEGRAHGGDASKRQHLDDARKDPKPQKSILSYFSSQQSAAIDVPSSPDAPG
eukprot:gnl/TRDRNA2_/TRDRNA2_134438_c3_seq1.p1 gnl/TRDRNA2_/TRDRNA2_134438_c3~~gnl/TRDRNA2_/TRDRNA2_134438_c3_seq1.p1  ORF type:complete len:313 (+),score=60.29 gnl/TRDRNA2_/TRDRNA2_134438_c3_seq1:85-1023(+)